MIDSSIEGSSWSSVQGKPTINSISLKDGEQELSKEGDFVVHGCNCHGIR